ncbi:MAG: SCO family protein [Verrucomicrobiales bacterium]
MPPSSDLSSPARPQVKPWTVWMLVAVIMLGGVIGTQLLFKKIVPEATRKDQRLPYIKRLEKDLEAAEASGKTVRLGQLQGKVYVIGYVYTTCSRGCAGVVEKMKYVQEKFAAEPRFHLVSVSVNPRHDNPPTLTRFREAHDLTSPQWWFLTGDEELLRAYMAKQVGFYPVKEIPPAQRLNEFDLFEHDMRLALVDGMGHVRGYYDVMHPDAGINNLVMEKLDQDIRKVLAEEVKTR